MNEIDTEALDRAVMTCEPLLDLCRRCISLAAWRWFLTYPDWTTEIILEYRRIVAEKRAG